MTLDKILFSPRNMNLTVIRNLKIFILLYLRMYFAVISFICNLRYVHLLNKDVNYLFDLYSYDYYCLQTDKKIINLN